MAVVLHMLYLFRLDFSVDEREACIMKITVCISNIPGNLKLTMVQNFLLCIEAVSKSQIAPKDKARADPPSFFKLWRDKRDNGAYMGVCEYFEEARNTVVGC